VPRETYIGPATRTGRSPEEAFGAIRAPRKKGVPRAVVDFFASQWAQMTPEERGVEALSWLPIGPAEAKALTLPLMGTFRRISSKATRRTLRDMVRREFRARGPLPKEVEIPVDDLLEKQKAGLISPKEVMSERMKRFDALAEKDDLTHFLYYHPWFSKVLRGSWFHGRRTYPRPGTTFADPRLTHGHTHLGEPTGLSITAKPRVASATFGKVPPQYSRILSKAQTRMDEIYNTLKNTYIPLDPNLLALKWRQTAAEGTPTMEIVKESVASPGDPFFGYLEQFLKQNPWVERSRKEYQKWALTRLHINQILSGKYGEGYKMSRVLPRFGGPPEQMVLPAWNAPETEWAQGILRDVYKDTAQRLIIEHDKIDIANQLRAILEQATKESVSTNILREATLDTIKPYLQQESDYFNKLFAEELHRRGYKGLLYAPQRGGWGEYELKMFNPEEVTMLDKRRLSRDELLTGRFTHRIFPQHEQWERAGELAGTSLRDIYHKIDWEDFLRRFR